MEYGKSQNWDKTIDNKLMYTPKIILAIVHNKQLKLLDTKLNEPANQKVRKRCYETLGTSVISIPLSPPSLMFTPGL